MKTPKGKPGRRAPRPGQQYAALPYRTGPNGLEVLLITSRETRRWIIPKGWPMKGRKPHSAAAREALEEAGVKGKVRHTAAGTYGYVKRQANGAPLACTVDVFPLAVGGQREQWLEQGQRDAQWFSVEDAAGAVEEPELKELIRQFGLDMATKAEDPKP